MENKLEQLLNSLVKAGWKPRGKNYGVVDFLGTLVFVDLNDGRLSSKNIVDLRKLTSKESGLWQFVCENGMVEKNKWIGRFKEHLDTRDGESKEDWEFDMGCAEYYIIESALKDENELEEFLLRNIKIGN